MSGLEEEKVDGEELAAIREATMTIETEQLGINKNVDDHVNRNVFDSMFNKISEL